MPTRPLKAVVTAFMLATLASAALAADGVNIEKEPAQVEERWFDPRKLPVPPPPLPPGLKAVTEYSYLCNAFCQVEYLDNGTADGKKIKAAVRVTDLNAQLGLPIISWLPSGCSPQLREHERGHADISLRIYQPAGKIAEELGKPFIGQVFEGEAKTLEDARKEAILSAARSFCEHYHARTKDMAKQMDAYYDHLTDHGVKPIPSQKAVELTLSKFGY